jgi:hypothetical protein
MALSDFFSGDLAGVASQFAGADAINTDSTYAAPNGADTVPSNALQSMSPSNSVTSDWSGFFQNVLQGVVSYSIAKDAAQSGIHPVVTATAGATPAGYVSNPSAAPQKISVGMLALLGVAGFAVYKFAK